MVREVKTRVSHYNLLFLRFSPSFILSVAFGESTQDFVCLFVCLFVAGGGVFYFHFFSFLFINRTWSIMTCGCSKLPLCFLPFEAAGRSFSTCFRKNGVTPLRCLDSGKRASVFPHWSHSVARAGQADHSLSSNDDAQDQIMLMYHGDNLSIRNLSVRLFNDCVC